jgi:NTE family protein
MRDRCGSPPQRVGLVLGAGGLVGLAYHAGVLAAIHHHTGWDPRSSDVIVGSSAGSIIAALLRHGASAEDLAAIMVDAPVSDQRFSDVRASDPLPRPGWADVVRAVQPPSPITVGRSVWNMRHARPIAAAASSLRGIVRIDDALEPLRALGDDWPERRMWIVAVGPDGRRRVFGRTTDGDASMPPISSAVAASCAVPGLFVPVHIGGVRYADGGAHSPTNADVLVDDPPPLIVVSSPMSAQHHAERGRWDAILRRRCHDWLEHEAAVLRAAGADVLVIEPGHDELRVMGTNAMASDRGRTVVRAAFLATGKALERPSARAVLHAAVGTGARP